MLLEMVSKKQWRKITHLQQNALPMPLNNEALKKDGFLSLACHADRGRPSVTIASPGTSPGATLTLEKVQTSISKVSKVGEYCVYSSWLNAKPITERGTVLLNGYARYQTCS